MKIKFWGVRGSIPVPGSKTSRYGGNTTCIEVRGDSGELIILDAGTGIFPLSQSLLGEMPLDAHIFNTHTHWDHIQGLPFFIPLFIPGNRLHMYGAMDPVSRRGIEDILAVQMQYRFFPVRECELQANVSYISIREGAPVHVGNALVTPVLTNHPVINFGYRIDCDGASMFFSGDHEPHYNIYEPEDDAYDEYQALIDQRRAAIMDLIRDVDVLIMDTPYTDEEYPAKKGWGHGRFSASIDTAVEANAGRLYCTHHEPTRSDEALETVFKDALDTAAVADDGPDFLLAREGLEVVC